MIWFKCYAIVLLLGVFSFYHRVYAASIIIQFCMWLKRKKLTFPTVLFNWRRKRSFFFYGFISKERTGSDGVCRVELDVIEQRQQEGAALIERHIQRVGTGEREQRSGRLDDCEYRFLSPISLIPFFSRLSFLHSLHRVVEALPGMNRGSS